MNSPDSASILVSFDEMDKMYFNMKFIEWVSHRDESLFYGLLELLISDIEISWINKWYKHAVPHSLAE